jgi:hypothetical protein
MKHSEKSAAASTFEAQKLTENPNKNSNKTPAKNKTQATDDSRK